MVLSQGLAGSAELPERLATAFSRHDFESVVPYLAPDIEWDNVGAPAISGRDAVIAACRESAAFLARVQTTFRRFATVVTPECVVTDSLADYVEASGDRSTVASCDLYTFAGGLLTGIRSYTVEVKDAQSVD